MSKIMIGSFRYSLDDKNRVRIPSKFRLGLGEEPCIVPGRKGSLYMVASENVEDFLKDYIGTDPYMGDKNDFVTSILANAQDPEFDSQGRFIMDKTIIHNFNIQKEVVFVGRIKYVEIWPAEKYDERFGALEPAKLDRMIENLKKAGL